MTRTIQSAVPPMAIGAAPTKSCRYRLTAVDHLDIAVRQLSATEIRFRLGGLMAQMLEALDAGQYSVARQRVLDSQLLLKAWRELEAREERARLEGVR